MTFKRFFSFWGGNKSQSASLQLPIVSHRVPEELDRVLQQYNAQRAASIQNRGDETCDDAKDL
ncbi:hypothetical protein [Ferrimonas gelatinilytica]|uniref:Uncharacterized protein n=1 Tax=Ferrimonas gelatinilytica TaxID=1255257 RepID=A0ABP9S3S7_9GAMM